MEQKLIAGKLPAKEQGFLTEFTRTPLSTERKITFKKDKDRYGVSVKGKDGIFIINAGLIATLADTEIGKAGAVIIAKTGWSLSSGHEYWKEANEPLMAAAI